MTAKRTKTQILLNEAKTNKLLSILESRKELTEFRKEIGKDAATIWHWRQKKQFPHFCNMYLKLRSLKLKISDDK